MPPRGVYFIALETRLPKICWQSEASVITEAAGSEANVSQARPAPRRPVGELAIDLPDDGAEREGAQGRAPAALDEAGIVEVTPGQTEQVVAERDHGQEMGALLARDRVCRVLQQEVESRPQRNQGPAEFVAQAGQQRAKFALVDADRSPEPEGALAGSVASLKCKSMAGLSRLGLEIRKRAGSSVPSEAVTEGWDRHARSRVSLAIAASSGDDNLVGQQGMSVGQIEHGLMGQLFRVIGARSTLEDDSVVGIDDMEVADPAIRHAVDMALDELGEFLMTLPDCPIGESRCLKVRIGIPGSHFDRLDLGGESTSDAGGRTDPLGETAPTDREPQRLRPDREFPRMEESTCPDLPCSQPATTSEQVRPGHSGTRVSSWRLPKGSSTA